MNRETALFVFGLSLVACSQRTTPLRDAAQVDTTASITPCKSLNDACPEAQVDCNGDADNSCLADKQVYFGGYCNSVQTNDPCNSDGSLTQDYRDYCEVEACLGGDKNKCLQDGTTQCKPAFCNALDELQDPCATWTERDKADGCDMSDEQAQCIANLLSAMQQYGTSSCNYPHSMSHCDGKGGVSLLGATDCAIKECKGITTFEACVGNYDALCDFIQ